MSEKTKLEHIAIIMDGNGRWAQKRGLPRSIGHKKGAEAVKDVCQAALDLGIKYLTLYAFSTENWKRPEDEVNTLMGLLREYLKGDLAELQDKGARIIFIGERNMLSADIIEQMNKLEANTITNEKLTVSIAISYGSRDEIINATKKIASLAKRGDILVEDIDNKMFSDMLYTSDVPDPDLLIRTSGEQRLSNYLLWQIAYTELLFTNTLWPDFGKKELEQIIADVNKRERRYGKI